MLNFLVLNRWLWYYSCSHPLLCVRSTHNMGVLFIPTLNISSNFYANDAPSHEVNMWSLYVLLSKTESFLSHLTKSGDMGSLLYYPVNNYSYIHISHPESIASNLSNYYHIQESYIYNWMGFMWFNEDWFVIYLLMWKQSLNNCLSRHGFLAGTR